MPSFRTPLVCHRNGGTTPLFFLACAGNQEPHLRFNINKLKHGVLSRALEFYAKLWSFGALCSVLGFVARFISSRIFSREPFLYIEKQLKCSDVFIHIKGTKLLSSHKTPE